MAKINWRKQAKDLGIMLYVIFAVTITFIVLSVSFWHFIQTDNWLHFFPTVLTSIVLIFGAYLLMR